jgi:Protein of unknown function (DUF2637)
MNRMHAMDGEAPAGPGLFEVNGHDPHKKLITNVRRVAGTERPPGSLLIGISTGLLALLGAGCFYVSWWGQYLFIFAAKQQAAPAQIQAGMLDAGMVILSGLSLGLARQGKPSRAERVLIQLCAAGSAAMNYLAADDASPRSVIVFTAAPVFAAIITDRVVSVVRRHALGIGEESAWRGLGRAVAGLVRVTGLLALYWLRFALAPKQTASGVRRMVLDAAPLPGVIQDRPVPVIEARPDVPRCQALIGAESDYASGPCLNPLPCALHPQVKEDPPDFASKREAFEWHYRRHPKFGDQRALSQVAKELAPKADLQWGTARTYALQICAADMMSAALDATRELDGEQS